MRIKYLLALRGAQSGDYWTSYSTDSVKSFCEGFYIGKGEDADIAIARVTIIMGFLESHGNYQGDEFTIVSQKR